MEYGFRLEAYLVIVFKEWQYVGTRLHSFESWPTRALIEDINRTIRARLDPLSRDQSARSDGESCLETWFWFFPHRVLTTASTSIASKKKKKTKQTNDTGDKYFYSKTNFFFFYCLLDYSINVAPSLLLLISLNNR